MSTTIGTSVLPNPNSISKADITPKAARRMADGTLVVDTSSASKAAWDLSFEGLTTIQTASLLSNARGISASSFIIPDDATTYSGIIMPGSYSEKAMNKPTGYYSVSIRLEES